MAFLRNINFVTKGLREFTAPAYEHARKTRFLAEDDGIELKGIKAVVTGANAGLGRATAAELAKRHAHVVLVCRSEAKGKAAIEELKAESPGANLTLKLCDLSRLADVRSLAAELVNEGPIHVLVNNAGILPHERTETEDGNEMTLATNSLGTYALTELTLPALTAAASASTNTSGFMPRVINISSGGMYSCPLVVKEDAIQSRPLKKHAKFDGVGAYAITKRHQVVFAERWTRDYGESSGVTFVSMHPGWADTEGVRTSLPGFREQMQKKLRTPAQGADTIVWLSSVSADRLEGGAFYLDRAPARKHLGLSFGSTAHSEKDVDTLMATMKSLAGAAAAAGDGDGGKAQNPAAAPA